ARAKLATAGVLALLELGEASFHLLELRARALEHGALHVELLASHELHALEPAMQQRLEVALEILAERAQVRRHRFRELAPQLIQTEARGSLLVHSTVRRPTMASDHSAD